MGLLAAIRGLFSPSPASAQTATPRGPHAAKSRAPNLPLLSHDTPAMLRALELAREAASIGEVPIGAVVYDTASGKIIGEGCNRREIDHDPAAHAELIAIRKACETIGDWRLNHCTLVVTLEPCPMCAGLIVNARVGRLVYGAIDPKAGATDTLFCLTTDPRLNHRVEPIGGFMAAECGQLLKDFFRNLRTK